MISLILHSSIAFFSIFYGHIFRKNWFDMYYLYITLLIAIHWASLKGECIVSLIDKWEKDPDYKIGSSPRPYDIIDAFGKKYSGVMSIVWFFLSILRGLSFYIVLSRNQIKQSKWFSLIFLIYLLVNINSYLYHSVFFILFIIILFNLKR